MTRSLLPDGRSQHLLDDQPDLGLELEAAGQALPFLGLLSSAGKVRVAHLFIRTIQYITIPSLKL